MGGKPHKMLCGRLAQWKSASFTPRRSEVQVLHRPPYYMWCFHASRTTTCCGYEIVNKIPDSRDETLGKTPNRASKLRRSHLGN